MSWIFRILLLFLCFIVRPPWEYPKYVMEQGIEGVLIATPRHQTLF